MSKKKKSFEKLLEEAIVPEEEWPYEVPRNWVYFKFTSIFDVQGGTQPPKSQFIAEEREEYVRLVQIRDFATDKFKTYIPDTPKLRKIKDEDILIARYGASIGRILTGLSGAYNVALAKVIYPEEEIDRKYLFWLLKSEHFQAPLMNISRSAQSGFNKNDLSYFKMPLPPLKEQKRIVEKVERLLSKVEEVERLIAEAKETFELRRAAILEKAFRGRLTEIWRETNTDVEVAETLYMKIKESQIGKGRITRDIDYNEVRYSLPPTWKWVRIGDVFNLTSGGTPKRSILEYYHGTIPWIKTGEIKWNYIYDSEEKITSEAIASSSAKLLPKNSVLVAMYGQGLTRGRASILGIEASCNQAVCALLPNDYLLPEFVHYYFMEGYQRFRELAKGGNQKNLSATLISDFLFPLPPLEEQKEIARVLQCILNKEDEARDRGGLEIASDNLKQSILSKAFRGELGTNDPSEESAVELLKEVLLEQVK